MPTGQKRPFTIAAQTIERDTALVGGRKFQLKSKIWNWDKCQTIASDSELREERLKTPKFGPWGPPDKFTYKFRLTAHAELPLKYLANFQYGNRQKNWKNEIEYLCMCGRTWNYECSIWELVERLYGLNFLWCL